VPLRGGAGEVVLGELVDVERDEIHVGPAPAALPSVAQQETLDEMLRVRKRAHHGSNQGDLLARSVGGPERDAGQRGGGGGRNEKGAAGQGRVHGVIYGRAGDQKVSGFNV